MKLQRAALGIIVTLATQSGMAGNAYQCPATVPVDSLHNRSGWYVGEYTPETGSYSATIGSTQTITISSGALVDTASSPHTWSEDLLGNGEAVLSTGSVNFSQPSITSINTALTGLDTQSLLWSNDSSQTRWPAASYSGAMHALIIQRNHLKSSAGTARRSDALNYAQDYLEYRLVGSTDTVVDGVSQGQLTFGTETLDVEIVTEYFAPDGWGDNDYCWRLFNNNNGFKGFEVQIRPVIYILGEDHSQIANLPDLSGDYIGTLELAYDALSTSRPVY